MDKIYNIKNRIQKLYHIDKRVILHKIKITINQMN
jgi:hypothetical protein